jgi:3'(2'), 5'-bisphosphate nucleotidase
MIYTAELAAARAAAERAGSDVLTLYHQFEGQADAPANVSTEADRRSQEVILQQLAEAFPLDAFLAEETTPTYERLLHAGPRLWIVDPIDGSRGFVKKLGEFSIMIALVDRGDISLGLVLEPARGRLTYAVRGEGCWQEDGKEVKQRCRVSVVKDLSESTVVRSRSEMRESQTGSDPAVAAAKGTRRPRAELFIYSAGIKLALLARGEADLYRSNFTGFNPWDVCAGQILVEEAGGSVTDAYGRVITYAEDGGGKIAGIIASNAHLHAQALAQVRKGR